MAGMVRDIVPVTETPERVVAENMRAERLRKRMSVRELGELLDVSPNWVSERETGKRAITVNNAFAIAAALGMRIASLLGIETRQLHPVVSKVQDALDDPDTTDWEKRQLLAITRNGYQTWQEMRRPPAQITHRRRRS